MALTKVKPGNILLTTPAASSNDVTPATTQYVTTALANMVDSAPSTLNTLNELAAALGDDANFSTTVTNSIAAKLPLAGGTLTGALKINDGDDSLPTLASSTKAVFATDNTANFESSISIIGATNNGSAIINFGDYANEDAGQIKYKNDNGGSDYMSFTTNTSEAMRISHSGKVGIGTNTNHAGSALGYMLTVDSAGASGSIFEAHRTGNSRIEIYQNSTGGQYIDALGTTPFLALSTGGTQRVTIDSSGRMMIGTTTEGRSGEGADMLTIGATSNNSGMTFRSGTSGYGSIYFSDGTSGTDEYKGYLQYGHADDVLHMAAGASIIMNLKGGKVGIGGNITPDNLLEIRGGGYDQIRIGNHQTDNTAKTAGIVSTTYTNQSVSVFQMYNQNGNNAVYYGSADTAHRGLQNHYFYINTDYNSTSGHKLAYNIKSSGGTGHEWYTQANSNSKKVAIHNGEGLYVYNEGGGGSNYGNGSEILLDGLSFNGTATHTIAISGNLPGYANGQYNCLKTSLGDLHFVAGGTYTGYISSSSGFTDVSDEREKENIVTISNATTKLKQLRGVYHTWKDTENKGTDTQIGLIAQEVEAVVPEVVTTSNPTSLNTPESDTAGLKGVAYAKLVPLLIETIKELEERIATLEG